MRITFAIGSRANWGSARAVVERLRQEHDVRAICYATAVLERYGDVSKQVERVCPVQRAYCHVEGGTPQTACLTAGLVQGAFTSLLTWGGMPDIVYVVGDRYEVQPVAYAAHLLGIKIAHQMGGEVSGTIDDKIRHSITQLADYHFVATEKAGQRVHAMLGEGPQRIHVVGCPRIDVAKRVQDTLSNYVEDMETIARHPEAASRYPGYCKLRNNGRQYIVVMYHPDVDSWTEAGAQMKAVLDGVDAAFDGDVHLFWPNSDPGCEAIVQAVRERKRPCITHRSLPDEEYYALLAGARCAVGNSSSFLREGSFLGTPVAMVGGRQEGRELGPNVMAWCGFDYNGGMNNVACAINLALEAKRPEPSTLYGDGSAAERIAAVLREPT